MNRRSQLEHEVSLAQKRIKEAPKDTITSFTLPAIPPMLTAPELRADFLVKHYWDDDEEDNND